MCVCVCVCVCKCIASYICVCVLGPWKSLVSLSQASVNYFFWAKSILIIMPGYPISTKLELSAKKLLYKSFNKRPSVVLEILHQLYSAIVTNEVLVESLNLVLYFSFELGKPIPFLLWVTIMVCVHHYIYIYIYIYVCVCVCVCVCDISFRLNFILMNFFKTDCFLSFSI